VSELKYIFGLTSYPQLLKTRIY